MASGLFAVAFLQLRVRCLGYHRSAFAANNVGIYRTGTPRTGPKNGPWPRFAVGRYLAPRVNRLGQPLLNELHDKGSGLMPMFSSSFSGGCWSAPRTEFFIMVDR
jgi:hypothetical protein